MAEFKMVVTDLDGTLLKADKHISEYTDFVLRQLHSKGILFVIATARPVRAVNNFLPWIKYDAGIFHNGAVIWDADGKIGGIGIKNPLDIVIPILEDYPGCHISVEADDRMYANFDAANIWPGIAFIRTGSFQELKNADADKIIIEAHSLEDMEVYQKYISDDLYLQLSENQIAMIMNKGATKTNGIRLVAETYGISMEEIVAFGDDYNDIEMLKACGKGIAVENALAEVKDAADEICLSNEEDGVAKWLMKNL